MKCKFLIIAHYYSREKFTRKFKHFNQFNLYMCFTDLPSNWLFPNQKANYARGKA